MKTKFDYQQIKKQQHQQYHNNIKDIEEERKKNNHKELFKSSIVENHIADLK